MSGVDLPNHEPVCVHACVRARACVCVCVYVWREEEKNSGGK